MWNLESRIFGIWNCPESTKDQSGSGFFFGRMEKWNLEFGIVLKSSTF
jgi:hypothetical protein